MATAIGNAKIGVSGHGPKWSGFSHASAGGSKNYGFLHHCDGSYSLINKKSGGGHIGFRRDNQDMLKMGDDGVLQVTNDHVVIDIRATILGQVPQFSPPCYKSLHLQFFFLAPCLRAYFWVTWHNFRLAQHSILFLGPMPHQSVRVFVSTFFYYSVCVCVCVHACVRVCVCVWLGCMRGVHGWAL